MGLYSLGRALHSLGRIADSCNGNDLESDNTKLNMLGEFFNSSKYTMYFIALSRHHAEERSNLVQYKYSPFIIILEIKTQ